MPRRVAIKNHYKEIQLIAQRSMLALVFISLIITLLIGRLIYLQMFKHTVYSTLSTQNWLDLVPIEPTRGLIYDRNGVMLANNIPVFSLDIIPYKTTGLNNTLAELGKIITLTDNDVAEFHKQLRQHRRYDEIPIKFRLTDDEVARFTENQYRFPGVFIKARLMRYYPYGSTFSHVLGYVGRINTQELKEIDPINYSASNYIGKMGIERFYEDDLHGNVGYEQVESDASGKSVRTLKEIKGTPGRNVYLTIDSGLQFVAEKAMTGARGAIVAIEPSTGQVLALISNPGYDPNLFVSGISSKDFHALQDSPDRPLFNRAIRGLYPPASTVKPFYALEGLESNMTSPDDEIFDPGWFMLPNYSRPYRDWRPRGHGNVNLSRAIMSSCDTYFYQLANRMGIHRLDHILEQFGFGSVTGIDLDDELNGVVSSPEWKKRVKGMHWYEGDTIISGIGQGYMQTTPLQLASAISTMANRGQRYMPYLMLGEQTPGKGYTPQQPIPLDPIALQDKEDWEFVIKAMQDVVDNPQGTAYRFGRKHSYTIAAKTGTAQVISKRATGNEVDNQNNLPERVRDHHWFIAFAPVDHPRIAVAIITENSSSAIEAARAMLDYYIDHKPYQPTPAKAEATQTDNSAKPETNTTPQQKPIGTTQHAA